MMLVHVCRPFTEWKHMIGGNTKKPTKKDSFFINIAGREYEIPFDDWYITQVKSHMSTIRERRECKRFPVHHRGITPKIAQSSKSNP